MQDEILENLHPDDAEKLRVLLRSFATPEDMKDFLTQMNEVHKEQERRRWAWDVIKKLAAAVTLLVGAAAAVRQALVERWFF